MDADINKFTLKQYSSDFSVWPEDRKINRKVYKKSIKVIFSELIRQDRLVIVDEISVEPKTKKLLSLMD